MKQPGTANPYDEQPADMSGYVPGGDVAALAAALVEIAQDPEMYARFASGAHAAYSLSGWESTQRHRYLEAVGIEPLHHETHAPHQPELTSR